MANLSTLVDTFSGSGIDFGRWQEDDTYGITISGGTARFADPDQTNPSGSGATGKLRSVQAYSFDSVTVELTHVNALRAAFAVLVQGWSSGNEHGGSAGGFSYQCSISIERWLTTSTNNIAYAYSWGGSSHPFGQGFSAASMRWLRLSQIIVDGHYHLRFQHSSDGETWSSLMAPIDLGETGFGLVKLNLTGSDVALAHVNVTEPEEPDPEPEEPDVVDNFDEDAESAPVGPECATLLDLIRVFSGLVRRAVRLTGPTSISMVDPNEPLPTGWSSADADEYYHASTRKLTAGAQVLSLLAGDLALEVTGEAKASDARLVVSDWRIPQRLPVVGLAAAPVKRIAQTFAARGYSASIEFAVPDVPLELRRT